jgi:hypothetical protein
MTRPQIVVRIPPDLLEKLNDYTEQTGASKTEVVIGALAHYQRLCRTFATDSKDSGSGSADGNGSFSKS